LVNDRDVPPELLRNIDPPRTLVRDLDMGKPVCGGRVEFVWPEGRWKGKAFTAYCAEPKCMTEGECTGPRFVPHLDQFTHLDPDDPRRKPRKMTMAEVVQGVERATQLKAPDGARPSLALGTRDEIAKYVGMVWKRTLASIRGGGWRH
jgi:hypothetical protein